jgi:hypothetical protein
LGGKYDKIIGDDKEYNPTHILNYLVIVKTFFYGEQIIIHILFLIEMKVVFLFGIKFKMQMERELVGI